MGSIEQTRGGELLPDLGESALAPLALRLPTFLPMDKDLSGIEKEVSLNTPTPPPHLATAALALRRLHIRDAAFHLEQHRRNLWMPKRRGVERLARSACSLALVIRAYGALMRHIHGKGDRHFIEAWALVHAALIMED